MDVVTFDITTALLQLAALIISILTGFIIKFVRTKIGEERFEVAQRLAELAVKFVEEAYPSLKGEAKYQKAAEWFVEQAKRYGITLTEDEVLGLIHGILRELKDAYGEDWAQAPRSKQWLE